MKRPTLIITGASTAAAILQEPRGDELRHVLGFGDPLTGEPRGYREHPARKLRIECDEREPPGPDPMRVAITPRQVAAIVDFVRGCDGPTLIHCQAGVSRSTAAGLLLLAVHLPPDEAVAELRRLRPAQRGARRRELRAHPRRPGRPRAIPRAVPARLAPRRPGARAVHADAAPREPGVPLRPGRAGERPPDQRGAGAGLPEAGRGGMTYRLDIDNDGERRCWVTGQIDGRTHVLFGLRIAEDHSRWYMRGLHDEATADPALATWIHDHAADFDAAGFDVRRWWHLWQCWDCMAPPLFLCRHHRTGKPMSGCHRGRRPRGVRP